MYWTLELASKLEDAPWPATKDELIDYAKKVDCYESVTNYPLRYCAKKYILQHADLLANSSFFYQAKTLNIVA